MSHHREKNTHAPSYTTSTNHSCDMHLPNVYLPRQPEEGNCKLKAVTIGMLILVFVLMALCIALWQPWVELNPVARFYSKSSE